MRHIKYEGYILPVLIVILAFLSGLRFGQIRGRRATTSQIEQMVSELSTPTNKLSYTLSLIDTQYVDSLSLDSIVEHMMPVVMEELDPHSVYIPASEMQQVNEPLEGEFDGIGVVFNMATDTVIVLNVIPSGPSDKAGVRAGDRIIRINDSVVAGREIPQNEIVHRLRGRRGTEVKLSLERQSIADLVDVTVVRDAIPLKSIEASFMIADHIGYIKLSQFARTSYSELMSAIASLRGEGMTKLIFDLRGNSGGYLDQAILIANEFLPEGDLIVYTEDRHRNRVEEFSDGNGTLTDIGLAVLIDEASASSSEILAGALQDNDRGTIIGRRSFGKGLVQRQVPFADGSALRITVARYFTPTGRSIQKPYILGDEESYRSDMFNRYLNNEFFSADSIHFADSLRYVTPKGKTVYGGGGIMPDLFVPLDTTDVTKYFVEVSGRNILYRYTIEYADRHRAELDKIETLGQLRAFLDADRNLLDDFVAYAARHGVKPVPREIAVSRQLIEAQLRAYISRNTKLESNGFYDNIYKIDNAVLRSLEVLNAEDEKQEAK
ncbi:MAG TPA: S41 family peptidase [Candidatus Alistipes excrementipullorum]|nr:S41 family peptidase [Candidatus Alistipes excrementipullorum]